MSIEVALYRTDDYLPDGREPVLPLLREVFEPLLGTSLTGCRVRLQFLAVEDAAQLPGSPELVNLRGTHGYLYVQISRDGVLLYRHPHPVREVLGRPLQRLLAQRAPDETHWGYSIEGPGLEGLLLTRPAPKPVGEVNLAPRARPGNLFHLEEVAEPPPPLLDLAARGVSVSSDQRLAVLVEAPVHQAFLSTLAFDTDVEDGGFLVGSVHRDSAAPDRLVVVVSTAVTAQRTGASFLHFTFTGESFLRIGGLLARQPGNQRLVGWYHTHLFAATQEFGLSTIDVDLHRSTFQQPWQIAALINIARGQRTLRCYGSTGDGLAQLSYQVLP